jgi:hypothetical protein
MPSSLAGNGSAVVVVEGVRVVHLVVVLVYLDKEMMVEKEMDFLLVLVVAEEEVQVLLGLMELVQLVVMVEQELHLL